MIANNLPLPITVVFVERVPWGGGAERVVLDIARGLDRDRFRPLIASLYDGPRVPPPLAANLEFITLDPRTTRETIRALASGRLRSDPELLFRVIINLALHSAKRVLRFAPASVISAMRKSLEPVITRLRLRKRTRVVRLACKAGKLLPFLKERLCRVLGLEYDGERIIVLPTTSWEYLLPAATIDRTRQARLLASLAASLRGPVVFIASMEEAATAVCLGLGSRPNAAKPFIVQTHALESYYLPIMYPQPPFNQALEHATFAKALIGADAVTSPSNGCAQDLIDVFGSPPERTLCVPNPMNLEHIRKAAQAAPERPLPQDWSEAPLLLCVGRYDPQKNHKLLFEACALLRRQGIAFHLVCIGDGHFRSELERHILELGLDGCVHLLGFVANPFPYMARARAHVTTSDSESFGLTIAESLACGCLPISLDCPHGPRDVLDGGRGGLLVRENTPEALAHAMRQALTDEALVREKLQYGQAWVEHYDISRIVPLWEALISHSAGERGALY